MHLVCSTELGADCRTCCISDATGRKFQSAVLEVCQFGIQGLPQIKDFIVKRASAHPRLQVVYRMGGHPKLTVKGPEGSESIRIDAWSKKSIEQYLDDKLVSDLPSL